MNQKRFRIFDLSNKQKATIMKNEILNYINENTNRQDLDFLSTKEIANEFGLDMKKAFSILDNLSSEGLIIKMPPVQVSENAKVVKNNLTMCDWMRVYDEVGDYSKPSVSNIEDIKARVKARQQAAIKRHSERGTKMLGKYFKK